MPIIKDNRKQVTSWQIAKNFVKTITTFQSTDKYIFTRRIFRKSGGKDSTLRYYIQSQLVFAASHSHNLNIAIFICVLSIFH